MIDWCLTSIEQFFSYIQDDFHYVRSKSFAEPKSKGLNNEI